MKARFALTAQHQVNTVGLIGHWKFHRGTVFDYSLQNHPGTLTGTTLTYRYPGLDLDGTDEHVVVNDHADFTPALTPFSISAWVYMHTTVPPILTFPIASKGIYNTDCEWRFFFNAADQWVIRAYDESVDDCYIGRYYTTALTSYINSWVHVVATYSGGKTNAALKIYFNGVRVDDDDDGNNAASFDAIENLTANVHIGRYSTNYADGLIDDVMIFNIEKSAAEVKSIYDITRGRYGA